MRLLVASTGIRHFFTIVLISFVKKQINNSLVGLLLIGAYAFAADVSTEFATAGIVPDILPKAPNELITVNSYIKIQIIKGL